MFNFDLFYFKNKNKRIKPYSILDNSKNVPFSRDGQFTKQRFV